MLIYHNQFKKGVIVELNEKQRVFADYLDKLEIDKYLQMPEEIVIQFKSNNTFSLAITDGFDKIKLDMTLNKNYRMIEKVIDNCLTVLFSAYNLRKPDNE